MSQFYIGDYVKTPRFLKVKISAVLTEDEARNEGFRESTHYDDEKYMILGKHNGINRMVFAAVEKDQY